MVYHGLSWSIMVYYSLSWPIMVYHGLSWFFMVWHSLTYVVYHGLSWSIMVYHGLLQFIMAHHGLSWSIMVWHSLSWLIMFYHSLSWFSWFIIVFHGLSWFLIVYHGLSWFIIFAWGATRDFSLRFSLIFDKIYILYQHVPTCANSCWKGNAPGQERDRVFSQMIGVPAPWQECPGRPFCPDQRLKDEEIRGCYQWVLDLLDLLKMICYFPIGESTRHGESNLIRGFSIFDGPQKRHNSRSAPHGRADLGLSSPSSHQRRQNLRRLKMFSAPHLNS